MTNLMRIVVFAAAGLLVSVVVIAQQADETGDRAVEQDTPMTQEASVEDVQRQLMQQRREMPAIKPTTRMMDDENTGPVEPAATVNVDESILGTAPGMEPPKLRREGEFLRSRRGRLMRSDQSGHVLFVFEADKQDAQERPMVLVPCQRLQEMEELSQLSNEPVVFVVSGKILVYRGLNYLLPTMVKLDTNRGNLEN